MAIYHCSVSVTSRSGGSSSVASAAYREAEKITDHRTGIVHDYSRKSDVIESITMLPKGAPEQFLQSKTLWNEVEKIEKRKDAQLFREVEVSLPNKMTHEQNIKLVTEYCNDNFIDQGMCATVSFHASKSDNPHAHIMLTMREVNQDGFGKKNRDWNHRKMIPKWRKDWAEITNKHLEKNGIDEKIDHRSLAEQGSNKKPTIHLGHIAHAIEKRGERSERGDINRNIIKINSEVSEKTKVTNGIDKARADFNAYQERQKEATRAREKQKAIERVRQREKIESERAQRRNGATKNRGFSL